MKAAVHHLAGSSAALLHSPNSKQQLTTCNCAQRCQVLSSQSDLKLKHTGWHAEHAVQEHAADVAQINYDHHKLYIVTSTV